MAGLALGDPALAPTVKTMLNTVSTDDAYVNGHVTFVAPRVAGQVSRVLVDDNYRVKKGDMLVQLDKEPYQIQVDDQEGAPWSTAEADLAAAEAQVRGIVAQARSQRWQAPDRPSRMSTTRSPSSRPASRAARAKGEPRARAGQPQARASKLSPSGGISKEELDLRRAASRSAEAAVEQALEEVHATRVGLGLAPHPKGGT